MILPDVGSEEFEPQKTHGTRSTVLIRRFFGAGYRTESSAS